MSFEYNPRTENPRRILRRRLGLQLFARRHDQQLTLEYVARRTGLKAEVIDRIEIGKGNVAWGDLLALIDFYGWRFEVTEKEGQRIERVRISRAPEPDEM